MFKQSLVLAMFAMLANGSSCSARTYYAESTVYDPYTGPVTEVTKYHVHYRNPYHYRYYDSGPSVGGFADRSAKTGIGVAGKAAKESLKAVF